MKCEVRGEREAVYIKHYERNVDSPREINICRGCHIQLALRPELMQKQFFPKRIKVPRSALPFFQQLYMNIVAPNGEMILDGKEIFDARYEVVDDDEWEPGLAFKEFFEDLEKKRYRSKA